ncbi:Fucose 4-O-acetylase [Duganella sp. CF517]|uniref:acyltransferase family protein n=1 Tax=Duganella sp. CF517 TaxID=1881038 RepID=UPI0008BEBAE3|nr:acyltransferase family protein [Duganella sp. CF517]SEN48596.1 Fucose 4-O-acetylase [Duganella sp. CF517]
MIISSPPAVPKKWIDVLKGIGIIAVVAGHAYTWENGLILPFIYLFHMPLFFFLSGYLYKPSPDLAEYFRKKTFHLLVPYAAFLLLLVIVPEIYRFIATQNFVMYEAKLLIKNAVLGGHRLEGVAAVFWFVTCLFLTQQIFNFLVVRFRQGMLLPVIALATALGFVNSWWYRAAQAPLAANAVLAALPLFYAGYVFKRHEKARWITPLACFIGGLAVVSLKAGLANFYDIKVTVYGIPGVTMVSALGITIALIAVAKQLARVPLAADGLVALGQASMVIMFVHQTILLRRADLGSANRVYGIVLAIAVSYLLYLVFKRFTLSRAFLLGSEADLRKLLAWLRPGNRAPSLSP